MLAAVGSYLDARQHGARWLLRIEDLDTARVIPGCADVMLRVLEQFGFEWDGPVLYQHTRRDAYRSAIEQLTEAGRTFLCSCTRKELAEQSLGEPDESPAEVPRAYPGTCRGGATRGGPTALRFRVDQHTQCTFDDLYQGPQHFALRNLGDVVIERRDGIATYQLAVVVDDLWQGVTRVVRGADLLDSTPWQIALLTALGAPTPIYGHLPLVLEPDGAKLAKSRRSLPLQIDRAPSLLVTALTLLGLAPPTSLTAAKINDIWCWAHAQWGNSGRRLSRSVKLSA